MYIDLNKYSLDGSFACGKWDIICLISCYEYTDESTIRQQCSKN